MGGCTSDVYSVIKREHGQIFKKYIVGSESLTLFRRQIKGKLQELDKRVEKRRQTLHGQVCQREQVIMYHLNQTKLELDASIPGGTAGYEQMKRINIDSLLGLQEYKTRFGAVHEHINKEVSLRKQKIKAELEGIVVEAQSQYTIDPEKMNNYHNMSEEKRAAVRQRGVKEFDAEIKSRIAGLQNGHASQLDLDTQMKKFDQVISLEGVDQLAKMAQNKFKAQAINILGGFVDSTIKI